MISLSYEQHLYKYLRIVAMATMAAGIPTAMPTIASVSRPSFSSLSSFPLPTSGDGLDELGVDAEELDRESDEFMISVTSVVWPEASVAVYILFLGSSTDGDQ